MRKLSQKQIKFIARYVVHGNATQAAIEAGYSEATARQIGTENLAKPVIKQEIEKYQKKFVEKNLDEKQRLVEHLKKLTYANLKDVATWGKGKLSFIPSDQLSDDAALTISEISTADTESGVSLKIKQKDALKAARMLGEHLGLFRHEKSDDEDSDNSESFDDTILGLAQKSPR